MPTAGCTANCGSQAKSIHGDVEGEVSGELEAEVAADSSSDWHMNGWSNRLMFSHLGKSICVPSQTIPPQIIITILHILF